MLSSLIFFQTYSSTLFGDSRPHAQLLAEELLVPQLVEGLRVLVHVEIELRQLARRRICTLSRWRDVPLFTSFVNKCASRRPLTALALWPYRDPALKRRGVNIKKSNMRKA
jgi:hypothetical protein